MGIIGRAQAVLESNFNALLSRLEEPGRDIAHLLEEMKEQIHAAQRELIRVMGERKQSDAKLTEIGEQVQKWEKRAELAVRSGDDSLAREALAQKQRLLAERERLVSTRTELQGAAIAMKAAVERMKRSHSDFSSRQHTIATQVSQARAGGGVTGLGAKPGTNAFEAFENIESSIDEQEARVSAQAEIDRMLDATPLGTMTRAELDEKFKTLEQSESDEAREQPKSVEPEPQPQPKARVRIEP